MDLSFPQAEAAVIGALLIDPDAVMPRIATALMPDDFSNATLRHLFDAAKTLWLARKPVDPVTIGAAAGSPDDYARVAHDLMETVPSAAEAELYAEIVRSEAQLRTLRALGVRLASCTDLREARDVAQQAADASGDHSSNSGRLWRDLAKEFVEHLSDPPDACLDLGIDELTRDVRMQAGQFVVIGAYNSVGKTAFSLQIAFALAKSGKSVGFFSCETRDRLLAQRIFAQQTTTRMTSIKDHTMTDDEIRRAMDLGQDSWDYELRFYNASGWSISDIRARILADRLDVVIIDYVQLLAGPGDNPALEVRAVSMGLHDIAQQLNVTVIGLSQVTPARGATGKRLPLRKEHLRESQQLANDADIIILLDLVDQDDYTAPRLLRVDKNKDFGQAQMTLAFNGPTLTFRYIPTVTENETASSRDRLEKMDRNREAKRAKASVEAAAREEADSAFRWMEEGDGDDLPF